MIGESIKEGFKLANRNIQLVFIRIALSFVKMLGFVILIGIPLVAGIGYLGMDIAQAQDLVPVFMNNPFDFAAKYLGLVLLLIISIIISAMFTSFLSLYAMGGTVGVLGTAALESRNKFSLKSFFNEANKSFFRLFWLFSILLAGFTAIVIVLVLMGGVTTVMVEAYFSAESAILTFLNSFAMLSMVILGSLAVFACAVVAFYSIVILVVENVNAAESVSMTCDFLKKSPRAFLLFAALLMGCIVSSAIFYGLQTSVNMSPAVMPLFYLMNAFLQAYLAVILWGSLVSCYLRNRGHDRYTASYEI